jgi:zinc protease
MSSLKNTRTLLLRLAYLTLALAGAAAHAAVPIEHWTLPSGAKVYLATTDALPIVDVQIDFDAGSRRDPPAQSGLAGVTAGMVEKGIRANGSDPAMDQNVSAPASTPAPAPTA